MTGRQDVNSQQSSNPSPWVSNDYFEPTTKFEESRLGDAKEQLEGLCTIYHRVASVYHDQQDSKQYQFILSFFFTALLSSCKMAVKKSEDVFVKLKKSTK